ncbi:MAG: type I restriction endonuclease subunit R [Nostoc sp. NOS(2021)]|uniref:type I restriction endonuclease n=1 Tax=Nostoc sp. NOS(2021) TaxID=2815407 RepID=UPI0025E34971|nr:type I restriction endonuclease [Nostoc sp. NOS(2021)]MBN3895645.1 type I restriction endonuclease subunit R [Nostoc sp. NOS(2021)]
MNPAQLKKTTAKASRVTRKLRRRFDLTQSVITPSLLTWFEVIGYTVLLEPDIALGKHQIGRSNYTEVVLRDRFHDALQKINPKKPDEAIAAAIYQVTCTESSDLLENNRRFHKFLTDGVEVEYLYNQEIVHDKLWLIDTSNLLNNDWLAIHPLTVVEESYAHCPDLVVFINGLPLAVIVSLQSSDQQATFKAGYQRIQTYIEQIPKLFDYNTFLVITYGNRARVGTLTSDWQEFLPWRTIDGEDFPAKGATELEVLIQGIFDKRRFLEQVLHLIVFEENGTSISKKLLRRPFCTTQYPKKSSRQSWSHNLGF